MDFLGVRQHALFSFKTLIFSWLELCVVNFALLEDPEIDEPEAVLLSLLELFDPVFDLLPGFESLSYRLKICCGEVVEQSEADGTVERNQRFVLRVNAGQVRGELFEHRDGSRLIIYEDAALGGNFAAENKAGIMRIDAVLFENATDDLLRPSLDLEYGRKHGALGGKTNDVGGGFLSHEQGESVDEDGLARSGLPGQQIQA